MEVALEEEVVLDDVIGRRDGAWSTALWTAWDTAEAIDLDISSDMFVSFPVSETEIIMWLVKWTGTYSVSCIKLNHNLLVKSWTHDLKSGFITSISNHGGMIWNQDLLYQIMNAWFEIRIYYNKSQTYDLKSGFIISNHNFMIWNQDLLYQIINLWFKIRISYIKSWTHDLKSAFIISDHKLMIRNQHSECPTFKHRSAAFQIRYQALSVLAPSFGVLFERCEMSGACIDLLVLFHCLRTLLCRIEFSSLSRFIISNHKCMIWKL